ncbi:MAG TPA: kynureninase [Actinomycetes bacterium]|jgi:kynureninase|nr:kynureninase [Actinomycetes bacterium]
MTPTDRTYAQSLDAADPLGHLPDRFVVDDPELIYLDGNSLGRLPRATLARLAVVAEKEWGSGLIRSWDTWIDLPTRCGDLIARSLLGAEPGEVVVSDSTSVNLYKLAVAALDAQPGRDAIVTDDDNFPTDRYIVEGLAAQRGLELRMVASDPVHGPDPDRLAAAIDKRTALVTLSHVAYRSAALADLAEITALAHRSGALVLWDLCHSAGSVPVELAAAGADLAVGCTYKYLNAGPGAPAFLYVRRDLQASLRQPIWGWFGQRDQFAMGSGYDPEPDIRRFTVGTPAVLGVAAVEEGVQVLAEAGIHRLRDKGRRMTGLLVDLADEWLAPLGFEVASPRDPDRRGSHISLQHDDAWRICRAYIETAKVIPDFRAPDRLRLGPAPLTTRYVEVWEAMDRLRRLVESGAHVAYGAEHRRVT